MESLNAIGHLNVKSCIRTLLCSISGTEHLKELKMVHERTEFET